MLNMIRRRAASVVVKLLFVVLVLSFVVWGVADVFTHGGSRLWAAKVNGQPISMTEYQEEYRTVLRRVSDQMGSQLNAEQARALGLPTSVLNRLVEGRLVDQAAHDLGVVASDELLRQVVQSDERFHDAAGKFDATSFRNALRQNGYSEESYLALLRRELVRAQLLSSITAGVSAPIALTEALAGYYGERRVADLVEVSATAMAGIADPDEATARQFYTDNPTLFTAPERRTVTLVTISSSDLAKNITVSDRDIEAAYQERQSELKSDERRSFEQLVFADEAAARRDLARLQQGADPSELAKEGSAAPAFATIGPVTRSQLPGELADTIFTRPKDSWSEPVRSPIGWHLVKVTNIQAAGVQPFSEVRDKLRSELQNDRAADELATLANKLDDAVGRGTPLDAAARNLGLPVRIIKTMDADGKDSNGVMVPDVPPQMIQTAFSTPEGQESSLVEPSREEAFILRVDQVIPSTVQPFDNVRNDVIHQWLDKERNDKARALADHLAQAVRDGKNLSEQARASGLKVVTTPAITRAGEGATTELTPALISAIFANAINDPSVVPGDRAFWVVSTQGITPASAESVQKAEADLEPDIASSIRTDLLTEYLQLLHTRYSVQINEQAIERVS